MRHYLLRDFAEIIGTLGDDVFETGQDEITFGLDGDDVFISKPGTDNNVMVGGPGDDVYYLQGSSAITIIDDEGFNVLYARGLGFTNPHSFAVRIDSDHLYAYDFESHQQVLIANQFIPGKGISLAYISDGVFTQQEFMAMLPYRENYLGEMTVDQFLEIWPWDVLEKGTNSRDVHDALVEIYMTQDALLAAQRQMVEDVLPTYPTYQIIDGFDSDFYLTTNLDVAQAGMDPKWHYDHYGWSEGRNPNAWFDTEWYLMQNPDVKAAEMDPLLHYWNYGWMEDRAPSPEFDGVSYLQANPDVAAAGFNPLDHWLNYGIFEGRVWVDM